MSTITLKRVRRSLDSEAEAIEVTLFKDLATRICGWFIGPVRIDADGVDMAFLPPSERTLASVAIVRAIDAARAANLPLCVVDPDDLWSAAWQS